MLEFLNNNDDGKEIPKSEVELLLHTHPCPSDEPLPPSSAVLSEGLSLQISTASGVPSVNHRAQSQM